MIGMCRDDFITINWENIKSGMEHNFLKYDLTAIRHLGAYYDTCSLMHYGANTFSKVNQTIVTPTPTFFRRMKENHADGPFVAIGSSRGGCRGGWQFEERVHEHGFLSILLLYVPDVNQSKGDIFFTFDAISWKDSSQSYKLL
jgi:hypothetical protein